MKNYFLSLLFTAMACVPAGLCAQVTIGSGNPPSKWSLLDLDASENPKALHLPRLSETERNALVNPEGGTLEPAKGLMIFNTTNNCLEFWNGESWISLCYAGKQETELSHKCGAYIAPGVWREFMCHNLGADYNLDPFTPHQGLHGAIFKWGATMPALTAQENIEMTPYITGDAWEDRGDFLYIGHQLGLMWNMETANPCPPGFRVPTNEEWWDVIENNTWTFIYYNETDDLFTENYGKFDTGIQIGTSLFLPAVGQRDYFDGIDGTLAYRGITGHYWNTSTILSYAGHLKFSIMSDYYMHSSGIAHPYSGFSIRCIAE